MQNNRNREPRRPVADLYAIVPTGQKDEQGRDRTRFVAIAPLFENADGSLSGVQDVAPILWANSREPRRVQIRYRDDRHKQAREALRAQGVSEEDIIDAEGDDIPF